MSVTATFQPDRVGATPGAATALALHLHNESDEEKMITLRAAGGLAERTALQTETIFLDPNEQFDVPVTIDAASLPAGSHACVVEVVNGSDTSSAEATIDVDATEAWAARLEPQRSKSGSSGRHKVAIDNSGNVPVTVELAAATEADVVAELATPAVSVDPGKTAKVEFRLTPSSKFWGGGSIEHPFSLSVTSSEGEIRQLDGIYEQGPRMPTWIAPALAGAAGALLLGTAAWFALLKPSVEDAARADAMELDLAQQDLLDQRVVAIEAAAEEASELPLGEPTDLRLEASADPAVSSTRAFDFDASGSGRTLSITDVIFQNPSGAVGRVELLRDDDVLLEQEMANFRDLDFHLVAPLRIESGSSIALRVTCSAPGPSADQCEVAATVIGFVDSE